MNLSNLTHKKILIYGANGYTGRLVTSTFVARGLTPILAGRSPSVQYFAEKNNLEARIFEVNAAAEHLAEVDLLINTAGPFERTQGPLMDACIETGTHYLDVSGKMKEVDRGLQRHEAALAAGVVLLPSAGFGIAPPDIAARMAINTIENADRVRTVAATYGGVSRGTLFSILSEIDLPGKVWTGGRYEDAHPAEEAVKVTVFGQEIHGVNNPLRADLRTVPHAHPVTHYQSFMKLPGFAVAMMHGKLGWLRRLLLNQLTWLPEGPSARKRLQGYTLVWAEAQSERGDSCTVEMKGPEAYDFTAAYLLLFSSKLLEGSFSGGFQTPGQVVGKEIEQIDGVKVRIARN